MQAFVSQYGGSILIGLALCAAVAAVILSLIRKKKKGVCGGCGCGCENCPMHTSCHGNK